MPRNVPVSQVMTTDVLAFHAEDRVEEAARAMAERRVGGAPVVDADGTVIGMLEDDDLIVADARLHAPTVFSVLGFYLELPGSQHRLEEELRKATGATVGEVMDGDFVTCAADDTLESVATILHERNVDRLPVVDGDGRLVGVVSRGDLVRAMVAPPLDAET